MTIRWDDVVVGDLAVTDEGVIGALASTFPHEDDGLLDLLTWAGPVKVPLEGVVAVIQARKDTGRHQ